MTPRLVVVVVTALVVQAAVAPQLRLLGATPAVLVALAVAGGIVAGPDTGAMIGFIAGVGMDLLVESPFGLWALTGAVIGWGVGHLHGRVAAPGRVSVAATAFIGTAAGVGLFVVFGSLLGERHLIGLPLGGLTVALAVYNVAVVPVAVRAVTWSLSASTPTARRLRDR